MLGRKRERFDRTDVPVPSRLRNIVAGVVLGVVLIAVILTVTWARNKATATNYLEDSAVTTAISAQSPSNPDGYERTDDTFDMCLLLVVDDITSNNPTLESAQIFVLNENTYQSYLVNVPGDLIVSANDSLFALYDLCSEMGAANCIAPIASSIGFASDHAVIAESDNAWSVIAGLQGNAFEAFNTRFSGVLNNLRTDMDLYELNLLAAEIQESGGIGIANRIDMPYTYSEGDEYAPQGAFANSTELGLQLGTLEALDTSASTASEEPVEEGGESAEAEG